MKRRRGRPRLDMEFYERWVLRVAGELAELVSAELWSAGTLGIELLDGGSPEERWSAYFELSTAATLSNRSKRLERLGVVVEATDRVASRDWMESYRRSCVPFAVGNSLWIDPREPGAPGDRPAEGRARLSLPARSAFGIGTHESTRLAVELVEAEEVDGLRCLDLGTGSGILSFLLLLAGAAAVVGIDIDPVAALQAGQNGRLNRLAPGWAAATLDAVSPAARFDLCVANMLPVHLVPQLDAIAARVPVGPVLIAGALGREDADLSLRLEDAGLRVVERRSLGEWIGYRTFREPT